LGSANRWRVDRDGRDHRAVGSVDEHDMLATVAAGREGNGMEGKKPGSCTA